jgi:hypothetical protein
MKITIQITTSNLKKLTEDGGYNELVFNVEEPFESSGCLRGMRVARDTRYFTTSKQARKVDAQREKQQKRLEAYVSRQVCKSVQVCQTPVSVGRIVESSNYPTARSGNRSGLGSHCVTAASDSALR